MKHRGSSILLLAVLVIASPGAAWGATITEFSTGISANSVPTGITAGPDGNLWFTESSGTRVARITPAGSVTEFSAGITASSSPYGIAAGPDGNLWFTETTGRVARITTAGVVTEFSAGITTGSNPWGITAGPDGNLWFTEASGNRVARVTTAGAITEFPADGNPVYNRPTGITAGPDGNVWFVDPFDQAVARVNLPAGTVTRFPAAFGNMTAYIATGSDNNLWFSLGSARVGRMTPAGALQEFSSGITPNSGLSAIAAGPDGNLWLTASNVDHILRITPAGAVTEFSLGITPGSGLAGIAAGPDGNMWFTESQGNRIGRLKIEPPSVEIGDARNVALSEATITGSVNPRSDPSTYFFEYGTTSAYGSQTPVQNAGAAATAGEVSAPLTGLSPETTYHYRLRATNAGGLSASTQDRTFTTAANLDRDADGVQRPTDCDDNNAAVRPGAPDMPDNGIDEDCTGADAVNLDRDGDGFNRPEDCNDADPAIHRGVPEQRGDAVDEDCDGIALPFLRITSGIRRVFQVFRGYTIIKLFVVRDAPVGAIAELRCRGRGCPPKSKRLTSRGGRELRFTSHLAGRRLRPRTVLEIRITLRDRIGKVVRYRMRAGRLPRSTVLCLPPGQAAPAACPPGT